VLSEE
jgi:hypothetical protein